ncbi:MAG: acetyl-CoA carboxylase carboxyltransferase subunit alpha [Deltaproteobacteria bacterium]|nr:acetyl-CoA carboxylase carboxyltransferase subunit alpha [Deltaproteobacteria bacterium]
MADFSNYLDFERPVVELETELMRLKSLVEAGDLTQVDEVERVERKLEKSRTDVYGGLTAYQRVRLSRHFDRPFTLDYVDRLITGFVELHGDRLFRDDPAIVAGIGKLNSEPVAIVGQQRGRTTQERIRRNFGMPNPEGYRKALRIFHLAERFGLPLLLFIDTQGAFPGLEAEERGQAEAIARNLYELAALRTPVISIVIGEGGSGGALALGVCDRLMMLENSTYSVITPEGCASILWGKSDADNVAEHAKTAAESLQLTARSLKELGVCDEIIKEPQGGAHRDPEQAAELVGRAIVKQLATLRALNVDELIELRYKKFRAIGQIAS